MDSIEWMAWTRPTLIFDIIVISVIAGFSIAAIVRPSTPRKGLLPMETARGDRLYISLIGLGLFMVLHIALTDASLVVGFVVALCVWVGPILRWG